MYYSNKNISNKNKIKNNFNYSQYLFSILLIIKLRTNVQCDSYKANKIFFPANVYRIKNINKKSSSPIVIKKIENILNAYNLYYNLYKKNLNSEEVINICDYIHKYYRYYNIHERALVLGIYKLILAKDMIGLMKIQTMLHEAHWESPYLYLGYLFLVYNEILQLSNNPIQNIQIFYNIEELLFLMQKNPHQKKYLVKLIKVYYIHQYFMCEYYLALSLEYIKNNQLVDGLLYLRKILVRSNAHTICSLEALLLMLEIFVLLDIPLLVKKYFDLILKIYWKNINNSMYSDFIKTYLLRALYILRTNNYLNLI
jgi:hypothetical protein